MGKFAALANIVGRPQGDNNTENNRTQARNRGPKKPNYINLLTLPNYRCHKSTLQGIEWR